MAIGQVTHIERIKRLGDLKLLREEGKTDYEIAEATGMSLTAVKRGFKYIEELGKADISLEIAAEKRNELWISLSDFEEDLTNILQSYIPAKPCPVCNETGKKIVKRCYGKGENRTEEEYEVGCDNCKGVGFVRDIFALNKVMERIIDITDRKMKLFGLEINQPLVNVNQQFNMGSIVDKIPSAVSETIAKKLIDSHESKKRTEYEED